MWYAKPCVKCHKTKINNVRQCLNLASCLGEEDSLINMTVEYSVVIVMMYTCTDVGSTMAGKLT